MKWKLSLDENVCDGTLPGETFADQATVLAVKEQTRRTDASRAVVPAWMEKLHTINTELSRVENTTWRFVPMPSSCFGPGLLDDFGEADTRFDRMQRARWYPRIEWCRRDL